MNNKLSSIGFGLLALTMVNVSHAQDLNLFEDVQSTATAAGGDAAPTRERRGSASAPAYTLIGTSRIGGKRMATLMGQDGEAQKVEFKEGARVMVPGSPGITIVDFGPRTVSLQHPESSPCVSAVDKGVSCVNGLSVLSLTTAAPIRTQAPVEQIAAENEQASDEETAPANPFAAALRAAAENGRDPESNLANSRRERFQPRRIADEDVPEGMRLVRTPFGDRLVER